MPCYLAYPDAEFNPEDFALEICVPVSAEFPPRGRIQMGERPAATHAWTMHVCPYEELHRAYQAVAMWLSERNLEPAGGNLETYHTGPGDSSDPRAYRTEAVIPVAAVR